MLQCWDSMSLVITTHLVKMAVILLNILEEYRQFGLHAYFLRRKND